MIDGELLGSFNISFEEKQAQVATKSGFPLT